MEPLDPSLQMPFSTDHSYTVRLPRVVQMGWGSDSTTIFFQQGTVLSTNPYVLQIPKDTCVPDAAEFNPDRWLGPDPRGRFSTGLLSYGLLRYR